MRRTGGRRSVRFEVGWCIFKIVYNYYCCTYSEGGCRGGKAPAEYFREIGLRDPPFSKNKKVHVFGCKVGAGVRVKPGGGKSLISNGS